MPRPTRVTLASTEYVGVRVSKREDVETLVELGFVADDNYEGLYFYEPRDTEAVYEMYGRLRDLGIPFSTHRTGGAGYAVEVFRRKGRVSGKFKRINFFDNDADENAPFAIEEF